MDITPGTQIGADGKRHPIAQIGNFQDPALYRRGDRFGTNGASDPASGGPWNTAASSTSSNGMMVRWDSGGGEKVSVYWHGVGWTVLN